MMEIKNKSENEIVCFAKNGDANAMEVVFDRYKNTVKAIARSYFLVGGEEDDLVQEGMIGVYRAVITYNEQSPFKPYAIKCIKSSIITTVRRSLGQKNIPLNNYVSISGFDDDDIEKSQIVMDETFQPELKYINSENVQELKDKIKEVLSTLEQNVLTLFLQGYSYTDIGEKLNKKPKSIDNALQRIRKKILLALN